MSYMKELWAQQEQERAEEAQEEWTYPQPAMGDLVKRQMDHLRATMHADDFSDLFGRVACQTATNPTANRRVSDCVRDVCLTRQSQPSCCKCGTGHWITFVLQDDPVCDNLQALWNSVWKCASCGTLNRLGTLAVPPSPGALSRLQENISLWLSNGLPQHHPTPTPPKRTRIAYARAYTDALKPREPKNEADKSEGTRDVDKFLKEQQNKLWEGMV